MTYSSRRKEVDMKKVIMIISVAAILVGCKGKEIWEHDLLQSQETKGIYEVVWHENGGFVIKDSVGGGCMPTFVGTALRLFKLKVVGKKYDKEGKV